MKWIPENIRQSQFARNVSVLAAGTIVVQSIATLISPVLSRLYNPEDYGLLAVFISCLSLLVVIGSFRYELAILIPKENYEANQLLGLSIAITVLLSAIIFLITFFFNHPLAVLLGNEKLGFWLYFLAPVFLAAGITQALTNWYNRNKNYKIISGVKIYQSSVNSGMSLAFGFLKLNSIGLMVSSIAAQLLSSIYLVKKSTSNFFGISFSLEKLKFVGRKYKEFPIFSLPSAILDTFSVNSIVLLLNYFFSDAVTGAYSFSMRILSIPTVVIGASIGQVFFQRISEAFSNGEKISGMIFRTWKILFLIGLVPTIIFFFRGQELFTFVFGNKWMQAGLVSKYLCILTFITFISSPTSGAMLVLKQQKTLLFVNIAAFIYRPLALLYGYLTNNFLNGIILYIVLEIIQIAIYNSVLISASSKADSKNHLRKGNL